MSGAPKIGDKVRSSLKPDWGLGKVVMGHSTLAVVYFKGLPGDTPEKKVAEFRLPAPSLIVVESEADVELDNLPPYENGRFKRARTDLTLKTASELFLKAFWRGFDDPDYFAAERDYKVAAHRRFASAMVADLERLADRPREICDVLWDLYHGPKGTKVAALNLMHPRWEAPVFFDALEDDVWAARYLISALEFLQSPGAESFAAYSATFSHMPGRRDRLIGKWPFMTWLPFIAAPSRHMMVRPSVTEGFASAAGFDIQYKPEANWGTYERILTLSSLLLRRSELKGLTLANRELDMIDLQSFQWVVQRYFQPSALEA